jgi:hypothetical protein
MFEDVKKAIQSMEGFQSLTKEQIYYANKWLEEGCFDSIDIPDNVYSELSTFMCLNF